METLRQVSDVLDEEVVEVFEADEGVRQLLRHLGEEVQQALAQGERGEAAQEGGVVERVRGGGGWRGGDGVVFGAGVSAEPGASSGAFGLSHWPLGGGLCRCGGGCLGRVVVGVVVVVVLVIVVVGEVVAVLLFVDVHLDLAFLDVLLVAFELLQLVVEHLAELADRTGSAVGEDGAQDAPVLSVAARAFGDVAEDHTLFEDLLVATLLLPRIAGRSRRGVLARRLIAETLQLHALRPVCFKELAHELEPELPCGPALAVAHGTVEGPADGMPEVFCAGPDGRGLAQVEVQWFDIAVRGVFIFRAPLSSATGRVEVGKDKCRAKLCSYRSDQGVCEPQELQRDTGRLLFLCGLGPGGGGGVNEEGGRYGEMLRGWDEGRGVGDGAGG
ncbi:predicted protein [Aspergillus terreus NIH2624]|uniref:Uncharacterized protein n=1 Tax=Aspergillus terreus (strain NIH 2624 / FGSC A1156) TaxID=341663 RepID=Q0CSX6_ASPTN|nr:uncharacterized protein ATEG_03208 [Aspergillus terreus NIH2624]EAU36482.1 predicted protein [Aspergillus terreus NIH2624]